MIRFFILLLFVSLSVSATDYDAKICAAYTDKVDKLDCETQLKQKKQAQEKAERKKADQALKLKLAREQEACLSSAQCLVDKYFGLAEARCPMYIERMAKYGVEWTDGWFGLKFKSTPYVVTDKPIVRFHGDSLKMQNGFGAWSNMVYSCDININTNKIVDFSVEKGRL